MCHHFRVKDLILNTQDKSEKITILRPAKRLRGKSVIFTKPDSLNSNARIQMTEETSEVAL